MLLNFDLEPLGFLDGEGRKTTSFPELADVLMGSAVIALNGDMEVKLRRKS